MTNQKRKNQSQPNNDSILEQLRDLGGGVAKGLARDVTGGVVNNAFESIFSSKKSDNDQNRENLLHVPEFPSRRPQPELRKPEVLLFSSSEENLAKEVELVRTELKKTASELKEFNSAIVEVEKAVTQTPVKAGKYHLLFFARLRTILKLFRQQVSESRVWLEASVSKRAKRRYWNMFKGKGQGKGTSFAQSGERNISTQAG